MQTEPAWENGLRLLWGSRSILPAHSLQEKTSHTELNQGLAPLPTLPQIKISGQAIEAVWALSWLWGALNSPQSLRDVSARSYASYRSLKFIFVARGIVGAGAKSFQLFCGKLPIARQMIPKAMAQAGFGCGIRRLVAMRAATRKAAEVMQSA